MTLLPQTEQEYWIFTINNRNRCYIEDLKQVYSLLEELMLSTVGYEWLVEVAMRNRNRTQFLGNLRTHYDRPVEHLKRVAKANQILENIHYKNENTAAEHSNYIDVGNQVINRLWQECCALAFLLIYDVGALPTVFL